MAIKHYQSYFELLMQLSHFLLVKTCLGEGVYSRDVQILKLYHVKHLEHCLFSLKLYRVLKGIIITPKKENVANILAILAIAE